MLSAPRGCEYFFCHRGSLFAAEVFYHTYVSKCRGQAYLLFLLYTMNFMLLHISPITVTSSSLDTQSSLQVGRHELYFTIAREQAACKCFQKRNLVLRLQVVTTACNFNALPRSSKGWRGKDLWGGTQSSPKLLSPSLAIMQASQKELENRQAKLLLFKSGVIQILKLAGDQLLNPENYTSVIPKMG